MDAGRLEDAGPLFDQAVRDGEDVRRMWAAAFCWREPDDCPMRSRVFRRGLETSIRTILMRSGIWQARAL